MSPRVSMALLVLCALWSAAPTVGRAQDDPTRTWIYCYGPRTAGRSAPPSKAYISGVTATREYGDTWGQLSRAYHAFVLEKYGADFEPYCTSAVSDSAARRQVAAIVAHRGAYYPASTVVVETGWTWTPSAADTTPPPAKKPRPDALQH